VRNIPKADRPKPSQPLPVRPGREPVRPSTLFQHSQSAADEINQGRFAATGKPMVVGSEPIVRYPELPADSPFHHDPVPDEPPLSAFENPALDAPVLQTPVSRRAPGEPATRPSVDTGARRGSPSSLGGDPAQGTAPSPPDTQPRDAGSSPPSNKRRP
jgi:hypothetical protein